MEGSPRSRQPQVRASRMRSPFGHTKTDAPKSHRVCVDAEDTEEKRHLMGRGDGCVIGSNENAHGATTPARRASMASLFGLSRLRKYGSFFRAVHP